MMKYRSVNPYGLTIMTMNAGSEAATTVRIGVTATVAMVGSVGEILTVTGAGPLGAMAITENVRMVALAMKTALVGEGVTIGNAEVSARAVHGLRTMSAGGVVILGGEMGATNRARGEAADVMAMGAGMGVGMAIPILKGILPIGHARCASAVRLIAGKVRGERGLMGEIEAWAVGVTIGGSGKSGTVEIGTTVRPDANATMASRRLGGVVTMDSMGRKRCVA